MNRHLLLGALLFVTLVTLRGRAQEPPGDTNTLATTPSAAQATQPAPFVSEPLVRYRLANGLEVLLQRDSRRPRVAISVAYHVGSADDPQGYRGLAHLVEHMMFEGSSSRAGSDYFEQLEAAGMTAVQGETGRDRTLYTSVLPRAHLKLGLWHEASRMAYLLRWVDAQDLERARAAVLNEAELRGGSWSARTFEIISENLYSPSHPYHFSAENVDAIQAMSLNDVRWFFQQWYGPANASLAVVGDFDMQAARAAIDAMFAPIAQGAGSKKQERPAQSKLDAKIELELGWRSEDVVCKRLWLVPTDADAADRPLDVLAKHLSMELDKLIVSHPGLTGADASYLESERAGEIEVNWTTNEESDGKTERKAIEALLARVRTSALTEAQLVRAREALRDEYLLARESFVQRSRMLALIRDPASSWDLDVMATRMSMVTSAQVLAAAQDFMAQERSLTACTSYEDTTAGIRLRGTRITPIGQARK